MEAIGLPKITPYLDLLPKNWDTGKWDRLTLEHIATGISLRSETIIRSIMDDRNEIQRAIKFLKSRAFQPRGLIKALKPPVVPRLPDPDRVPYEEGLIEMIRESDALLRDTVSSRNTVLRTLSRIPGSKRISDTDFQNRYVTAWMNNKIQLEVEGTKHLKMHHGVDDVHLSTNKRPLDAEDTSRRSSKRRTNPSREPAQYTPHVDPTTHPASAQILHGIGAPIYPSHDINVFPNPWSPNQPSISNNVPGHLTFGLQNVHGVANVADLYDLNLSVPLDAEDTSRRSSKRRTNPSREPAQYTPHVDPTTHPASAQILHGIGAPVYPTHNINVFPNPWSPNQPSISNNVPGHLTFGLQNVHGVTNVADLYDLNPSVHPTHSQPRPPPHSTTDNY
ncbi:hypothetical protein H0H93_012793 [Arthromyces matolae]|nr:hypothetical protein H0H93_012793 [Arthromyces matolae]